jgi:hypothetical protein
MLASLFGALVGGLFALVGGWLGLHWQTEREARRVAGAILAEMSVAQALMEAGGAAFYQQMLDAWKATGVVPNRQAVIDMLDNEPQDSLPVYYAMAGNLGLLPRGLAAEIVEYHAGIIALGRMVVRFIGKQELDQPTVKEIAKSIEAQFHKSTGLRTRLIAELASFASAPIKLLPFKQAA